jgi:hypothetical protein
MGDAKTSWTKSPGLVKVAERAKRHPDQRILGLAHLIDEPALERAFRGVRRDAAVGVDGVTVEQYGGQLAANVDFLDCSYGFRPGRTMCSTCGSSARCVRISSEQCARQVC